MLWPGCPLRRSALLCCASRVGVGERPALTMVCVLRSILRFLHVRGLIVMSLATVVPSIPRRREDLPRGLAAGQVRRLLDTCDRAASVGRRDFAILMLLSGLGLRRGEVAGLELEDVYWRAGVVELFEQSGDVDRSHRKLARRGSYTHKVWVSPATVRRVLAAHGLVLKRPRRVRSERKPFPEWADYKRNSICDCTHFASCPQHAVFAVMDLVTRKWITELVSIEETSTQVQVVFIDALEIEGLIELVEARQDAPPRRHPRRAPATHDRARLTRASRRSRASRPRLHRPPDAARSRRPSDTSRLASGSDS